MAFVDVDAAEVRVLDVDTGRVRTIFSPEEETYDVQYFDWGYAWSPDGRRLAVIRTAAVECVDDPTTDWCEQAQLSIVDVVNRTRFVRSVVQLRLVDPPLRVRQAWATYWSVLLLTR